MGRKEAESLMFSASDNPMDNVSLHLSESLLSNTTTSRCPSTVDSFRSFRWTTAANTLMRFLTADLPGPHRLSVLWLWHSVCPTRSSLTRSSRWSAGSCLWMCSHSRQGSHWCSTHGCTCQRRTQCPPEKVKRNFTHSRLHSNFRSKLNPWLCSLEPSQSSD